MTHPTPERTMLCQVDGRMIAREFPVGMSRCPRCGGLFVAGADGWSYCEKACGFGVLTEHLRMVEEEVD